MREAGLGLDGGHWVTPCFLPAGGPDATPSGDGKPAFLLFRGTSWSLVASRTRGAQDGEGLCTASFQGHSASGSWCPAWGWDVGWSCWEKGCPDHQGHPPRGHGHISFEPPSPASSAVLRQPLSGG